MVGLKSPVAVQENSSEDASENSNRFAALADHDDKRYFYAVKYTANTSAMVIQTATIPLLFW